MKLTLRKGKKSEGDKLILITADKEPITLIDLAAIINTFGLNELMIIDQKESLTREKHYWYNNLIQKALEDAQKGISWFDCEDKNLSDLKGYPYCLPDKTVERFLEERKDADKDN